VPSLYFYAAEEDHPLLLDMVFQPRLGFRVFETQSRLNEEIRQFDKAEDVLDEWWSSTGHTLALLAPGSRATPAFRKIRLRGASFRPGDYDFRCEGWGLIHLDVGRMTDGRLFRSTVGHNTEKRALALVDTYRRLGSPEAWDWDAVTTGARALIQEIRKAAPVKARSRPVLPGAHRASQASLVLDPT